MSFTLSGNSSNMLDQLPLAADKAAVSDLQLVLLPPGPVEARFLADNNIIDINLNAVNHEIAVNSDRLGLHPASANSFAFIPKGTEFSIRCENHLPGLLLEASDKKLTEWLAASGLDLDQAGEFQDYAHDETVADLGRAGMRFLRAVVCGKTAADPLMIEAIALGISARLIARLASGGDNPDEEMGSWSRRGNRQKITRAIEMAHCNIADAGLSVADMASAAGLSSCHFSTIFKAMTGESAYSFILRQRAQHAYDLIVGTRTPLSSIAYDSGFSSQAHMTTIVKRFYGQTPAVIRECK